MVTKYGATDSKGKPYPIDAEYPKLITELLSGFPNATNVDAVLQHSEPTILYNVNNIQALFSQNLLNIS